MYINPARWTTERIVTSGSADRLVTIAFSYVEVEGIWLPGGMTANFALGPSDSTKSICRRRRTMRQKPRNGTVTVQYSNYKLNTGLSDDIFAKDAPPR